MENANTSPHRWGLSLVTYFVDLTFVSTFCFWFYYLWFALSNMRYIKKTIPVKILMLCVANSSHHRKCFVRGSIHSLFVSKALVHSYLFSFGFWLKQLTNITWYATLSVTLTIYPLQSSLNPKILQKVWSFPLIFFFTLVLPLRSHRTRQIIEQLKNCATTIGWCSFHTEPP